jgi:hypothetical protein
MRKAILVLLVASLSFSLQGCMLWSLKCGWQGGWGCPTQEEIEKSFRTEVLTLEKKILWDSGNGMTLIMSGDIGEVKAYYEGSFGQYLVVGQKYPTHYSPFFKENYAQGRIVDPFYNIRK